jgi:asparagine synthase (glutamine-hydrolysing)
MCGISGLLLADPRASVDTALLDRMLATLDHRGPDAQGSWIDGPVGLLHNRLSILDLTPTGAQPMHSLDGRATIVFNGEIYNFRELRRELEARGARFRSRSDTEVLLEAWLAWGVDCLKRIEGMFAFALWDHARRTLFVARDRLGVKPLFYAWTPRGLVFGSEVKALLPFLPAVAIDATAFHQVLLFGCAASPRALVSGVTKLPPAQAFLVQSGQEPRPFTFWEPCFQPLAARPRAELGAELRERLTQAVRRQLVSDVPVGAFLSGGLDSSIVVSLMAREFREQVNTFSVGGRGFAASELPFAKLMSERLGVRHHPIEIDRRQFLEALPDVAWHNDEPTADPALVPLHYLSKLAKTEVTVVLCGEGADEMFAGYAHYPSDRRRMRQLRRAHGVPGPLRRAAFALAGLVRGRERAREFERLVANLERDPYAVVLRRPARLERALTALCGTGAALEAAKLDYRRALLGIAPASDDPLEISLRVDTRFNLADFLLVRADNMAMSASLEARVPFLDELVVEFATRLPGDLKLEGRRGKAILRDVFGDLLPDAILQRPKAPFPVPLAEWVLSDARLLRDTLVEGALVGAGHLERRAIERFLSAAALAPDGADRWDSLLAWRLFYLEVWARRMLHSERTSLAA